MRHNFIATPSFGSTLNTENYLVKNDAPVITRSGSTYQVVMPNGAPADAALLDQYKRYDKDGVSEVDPLNCLGVPLEDIPTRYQRKVSQLIDRVKSAISDYNAEQVQNNPEGKTVAVDTEKNP